MPKGVEVEIKLRVSDASAIQRALRRLGFTFDKRQHERDLVLDNPGKLLRKSSRLLRLRHYGSHWKLTFKGAPSKDPRYKSREEIELEIPDGKVLLRILEELGYRPSFRYEKIRSNYRQQNGRAVASLDRTPIGTFLELEGPRKWIDRTARTLGFSPRDYITQSYASLYFADCRRRGRKPGNMVFHR